MLTPLLVLDQIAAAPTLPGESLKATLKIVALSNSSTSGMREPWGKAVPPKERVPKQIQPSVRQTAVCKCALSSSKPLNIATIEHTWCYRSKKTHFDVAAAELVVAAEAGEDPGVPALPRDAAEGVGRHGLAHHDRDPVGIVIGGLRRRSLRGLLVRGGGDRSWDEGARLLVVVGAGAHGENRREMCGSEAEIGRAHV